MKKPLIYLLTLVVLSICIYASCSKSNEQSQSISPAGSSVTSEIKQNDPPAIPNHEAVFILSFSDQTTLYLYQNLQDENAYTAMFEGEQYDILKDVESNMLRGYKNSEMFFEHQLPPSEAPNGGYPGDCDLLGARKETETYSECYSRNFNNFCCDFTSCASFALFPIPIMTAIGFACLLPGRPLDLSKVYDLRAGKEVYNSNKN